MPLTPTVLKSVLRGEERRLVEAFLPGGRYAVVTDSNTYNAYGKEVLVALPGSLHLHDDDTPHPTVATAEILAKECDGVAGIIAVGSGTINDLCKYAAFRASLPYLVFPTAPSMNGYVSTNASLEDAAGVKSSLPARPPMAVLASLDVLASAPMRLIRAGLGDSLARSVAQVDWLFSHLLLGTEYDARPYQLIMPYERCVMEYAERLQAREPLAIEQLFRLLIMAGEGMAMMHSSAPFSQGEHMIAHQLESRYAAVKEYHHGEQIAVTACYMAERQEKILNRSTAPRLCEVDSAQVTGVYTPKQKMMGDIPGLQMKLDAQWTRIREALLPLAIPTAALRKLCYSVGLQHSIESFGISADDFQKVAESCRYSRDRFTCLDVQ